MTRKFFFALMLTLGLTACGSLSQPTTEITLTGTDFAYSPSQFIVQSGENITIVFQNHGMVQHDFVIEKIAVTNVTEQASASHDMGHEVSTADFDLHTSVTPGQSSALEFTPTAAGTYAFFCTVAGHKEAGMVGAMTVVPAR